MECDHLISGEMSAELKINNLEHLGEINVHLHFEYQQLSMTLHLYTAIMPFGINISNKQNTINLTLYFLKSRCTLCCCQSGNAIDGKLVGAYILTC